MKCMGGLRYLHIAVVFPFGLFIRRLLVSLRLPGLFYGDGFAFEFHYETRCWLFHFLF